jgi:hypothetical protein
VFVLSLVAFAVLSGQAGQAGRAISFLGIAALPVCTGVAILKYRLYEIDRIISSRWWTGGSTGPAMTLTRRWQHSRPT